MRRFSHFSLSLTPPSGSWALFSSVSPSSKKPCRPRRVDARTARCAILEQALVPFERLPMSRHSARSDRSRHGGLWAMAPRAPAAARD
eukprot:8559033-Pyramimonas_sp.AAC.2